MNQPNALRKFIFMIGLAVMAVVLLVLFYVFVVQPKVVITAPIGSTITITSLGSNNKIATLTTKSGKTTVRVGTDTYKIVASSSTGKWLWYSQPSLFSTNTFQSDNSSPLNIHTVAHQTGYDVLQSGTAISYLNTVNQTIESLSQTGTHSQLNSAASALSGIRINAQGIHVIANNQAIVLSNSTLYILRDNQLTPLNIAGFPASITAITIGTDPNEQSFVVAAGSTIFWYSSPSAAPQKVLTLDKRFDQLVYANSKIIAYSTRMPYATQDIKSAYSAYAIDPLLIDVSSKTQRTFTSGPVVDVSLSPDAHYATVERQGAQQTSLYDLTKETALYDVENPIITSPLWIDNTHFVYSRASVVWKFNVMSRSGAALGELPDGMEPTSITHNPVDNTYFVTTFINADTAIMYRLSANPVDANAENAAVLATGNQNNNQFKFSYVNLTTPTVLISTNVISNIPTEAEFRAGTLQARQLALQYLTSYGINANKLTILYDPANP